MKFESSVVRTSCRGCHGVCQVLVHLDSKGQPVKVSGDPESPTSHGYICPKGMAGPEIVRHPHRVVTPLRRTGPRGSGQWKAVSWDEALQEMAEVFARVRKKSGAEYVALCQGTGRPYTEFTGRFIHAFGSPNFVSPGHNCFLPRNIASALTVGWLPQPDLYGLTETMPAALLILGNNAVECGGADGICGSSIRRGTRAAQEVIVVDPRRTKTAQLANRFLQIRPGTDCALLLAMLHVIIAEDAYDREFVAKYCTGFSELAEHCKAFSPQWAEPITRIPAAAIREAALVFARTKPGCVVWGNGMDMNPSSFQAGRAALLLMAITGNLDIPGGVVRYVPPAGVRSKSPQVDKAILGLQFLPSGQKEKMIGAGRFPFAPGCHQPTFWEACVSGEPYRPKAVWLIGTNPITTATRGDLIETALRDTLEFTVVSDFFMTPTAELADLVLPAAHWLEQDDVVYFHKVWCVLARRQIVETRDVRDDRAVMIELAHRLGMREAFPWRDWPAYLEWLLEPSGMTFKQFAEKGILLGEMCYKKHESAGFPTPSGRVELVSSVMAQLGHPELPVYSEPALSPLSDRAAEYPYILMTGNKILPFFHSEGRQIQSLRRLHPEPLVSVHPELAGAGKFAEGDAVLVITPWGKARYRLHIDDGLHPDVVQAEHAWWFPEQPGPDHGWKECATSLLFGHEHFDPDSGAESLKSSLCRLEPA
ncbi:MAG: molybdopterin-dependent oxidoreductase [Desulfopila sp.]